MARLPPVDEETETESDEERRPAIAVVPSSGMNLAGGEYWRAQRSTPDQLNRPMEEEEETEAPSEALARVKFLLEANDAKYAPTFLLMLREMAEEPTDALLASRGELKQTQLLPPPTDTVLDEFMDELEPQFQAWQEDPLVGTPLLATAGQALEPAMLERVKEMEVVLKLAQKVDERSIGEVIRPRITEFGAEGQREVAPATANDTAINIAQLYRDLTEGEGEPWATLDAQGNLLLWTDEERLEEVLGIEDDRYTTAWRDNRWVLVTNWDDGTLLEAWLEENPNFAAGRPLLRVATRTHEPSQAKTAEFERR
jgi:hypothetical protein